MKTSNLLASASPSIHLHIPDFKRVALTLVGCGGTGSHIASGLIAIGQALGDRGIAMDLLFVDPDHVEDKNVGRQLFALSDIGLPKAEVIAYRLNLAFGARIGASVRAVDALDEFVHPDHDLNIVVGAVDNAAARQVIARAVKKADGKLWWLDAGNANHSGQVALGNMADAKGLRGAVALGMTDRLPAPHLVYPDLTKTPKPKWINGHGSARIVLGDHGERINLNPSCAELTAVGEQGLMVNRVIAAYALELLHAFLVTRDLRWFALAFDLKFGGVRSYALDVPTLSEVTGLRSDQLVAKGKATP